MNGLRRIWSAVVGNSAPQSAASSAEFSSNRMVALDVFRGLTIAGMILVNNPGSWSAQYAPLKHAEWHGWTPTDLVFPFFLFIVGVSITLALGSRVERGDITGALVMKIVRRSGVIFLLGLFLAAFPYFHLATLRIPGVLQRIAICYLAASLLFLRTRPRTQILITIALLIGYWLLMALPPVPGYGAPDLTAEGNLAAYLDRLLLDGHTYREAFPDPEGLLSTFPAIATTLTGVLTGHWLRSDKTLFERISGMFVVGLGLTITGLIWNGVFPINKPLWTSSYVVLTTGLALQTLAACIWIVDVKGYRRIAFPFTVFGMNALAVFVLSGLAAKVMGLIKIPRADGKPGTLHTFLYDNLFASWATPVNASLMFAICFVAVWFGLMWLLYTRKIFIKV
jgi:predicted acyltransferase